MLQDLRSGWLCCQKNLISAFSKLQSCNAFFVQSSAEAIKYQTWSLGRLSAVSCIIFSHSMYCLWFCEFSGDSVELRSSAVIKMACALLKALKPCSPLCQVMFTSTKDEEMTEFPSGILASWLPPQEADVRLCNLKSEKWSKLLHVYFMFNN